MASNNTKKQIHVSPGIYFTESELSVASKSLGITNLGLAGETLKGPAFQPIDISSWAQYQQYFGGTSTEKFQGSQYPKYELPYIAKTYLEESQNLKVCRVLGLSGVNAGPAWIISAYFNTGDEQHPIEYEGTLGEDGEPFYTQQKPMVVAVIRSRGEHKKAAYIGPADPENGICEDQYEYDKILYYAKEVSMVRTQSLTLNNNCTPGFSTSTNDIVINTNNYGTFGLKVTTYDGQEKVYSMSFNAGEKNYIYNVIGGNPEIGDAEIYVEELYDVALQQLIERGELNTLGEIPPIKVSDMEGELKLPKFVPARLVPKFKQVLDILTDDESLLKRRDVGKRFLFTQDSLNEEDEEQKLYVHTTSDDGVTWTRTEGQVGHIYTVVAHTTGEGTREYYYGENLGKVEKLDLPQIVNEVVENCVYVKNLGMYFINSTGSNRRVEETTVSPVTLDMNNYKEQYRYSSTPWIVSEMKGTPDNVELTKLFRFHTISDGDNSRLECKVSIENIDPTYGTFDVLIRDFSDTDGSPIILEKYKGCTLVPGDENYIALRIGSFDESYETKSKYVTVEVNETDRTKVSVPAGFLGYPVRNYKGVLPAGTNSVQDMGNEVELQRPYLQYNTNIYDEIRIRKQYFGMSDLVGIDDDLLRYKGVEAYYEEPDFITPCFHLDARILEGIPDAKTGVVTNYGLSQSVNVDGVKGYQWVTVGMGNTVGDFEQEPRIGNEETMLDTIYEDKRWRKFTVCFYGGFDGWDYYRKSRSNSDDFKYQRYRGKMNPISGEGTNFKLIRETEAYGFDKADKVITSDWYAYLSAIRQFANPKETDINVFATPGIDYVNNNLLVQEVIEMIEEERADSIYVITTPDKPYGAGDNKFEMYTAEDAVDNLDDSEIDTNWACTYFPWVKYFDSANNQYIYLPPTKDVVKNFAYTDNVAAPWFAAAGWNRGLSDGVRSKKNLVLAEQDELYAGRINFINNFADEGMRIWGDKNLQIAESHAHMNRISKRRCLIRLRKLISIACIGLVFDPNDPTMISSFRSAVQPILEDFITKRALIDAKLVIDDSEEARDRLEINAQIYLKFTPNVEYINIGLVATPQGVSFEDI